MYPDLVRKAEQINDELSLRLDAFARKWNLEDAVPELCLTDEQRDEIERRAFERTLAEIDELEEDA